MTNSKFKNSVKKLYSKMLLVTTFLILIINCSPSYSQIITRMATHSAIINEKNPIYDNFENYLISIDMDDNSIINFFKDGLDLRRASDFLEKYGYKISKNINNVSDYELGKFVRCSEPILNYLNKVGLNNKNLSEIITLFKKRIYKNGKIKTGKIKKIVAIKSPSYLNKKNNNIFLDNELFISSDDQDKNEISDLLKLTLIGNNEDDRIRYKFTFQNKDNDQDFSFINSIDYEEYIPEAYVSFIYHKSPYKKIDIGRYYDSMFYGNFYSGYTDGIRGSIENSRWDFMMAAESFEKRFEKNGFENMELSLFDTFRGRAKYLTEGGEISLDYLRTNMQPSPGNLPNWNHGISTRIYPAIIPVTTSQFSDWGFSGEKEWSSHLTTRGFIEFQDMEDFNPPSLVESITSTGSALLPIGPGKMGRSFEGNQYGLDIEYKDEEEFSGNKFFAKIRMREIDHLNLGRKDDFYDSEYLNNFNLSMNGFKNKIRENYDNSIYLNLGIDHEENVKYLKNPLHLRFFYETLTGWKDLDSVTPGTQDNVLEQYATGMIAEYRTINNWNFKVRVRNVIYNDDDYEYRQFESFKIGSAPKDRLEFDIRVSTPLF